MFVLFAAPVENELRWLETGVEGAVRFLRRVYEQVWFWHWRWTECRAMAFPQAEEFNDAARTLRRKTHQTIVRITNDFEKLDLNTNVAALMELSNAIKEFNPVSPSGQHRSFSSPATASTANVFAIGEALEALVRMLAPYAPHIAEEMWLGLGHDGGLVSANWPLANPELVRREELEIPIQVNGKLRSRLLALPEVSEAELRTAALDDEKIRELIAGREVVKVIVVPQRLVNVVVK
jgi:leucyl-tRNA synthetase